MFSQLENIKGKYIEVGKTLSDPATMTDMKRFAQLNKEYKELEKVVNIYEKYKLVLSNIETNKQILNTESDEDFREMAKNDLSQLEAEQQKYEDDVPSMIAQSVPDPLAHAWGPRPPGRYQPGRDQGFAFARLVSDG